MAFGTRQHRRELLEEDKIRLHSLMLIYTVHSLLREVLLTSMCVQLRAEMFHPWSSFEGDVVRSDLITIRTLRKVRSFLLPKNVTVTVLLLVDIPRTTGYS